MSDITIAPIIFSSEDPMDGAITMDLDSLNDQISCMKATLDEKAYRLYLGELAISIGRGGRSLVSKLSGSSVNTVKRGMDEVNGRQLDKQEPQGERPTDCSRIRKKGGGRKAATDVFGNLRESVEKIIDGKSYGDPEKIIHWTTLSLYKIKDILSSDYGINVSHTVVAKVLGKLGYSKQLNQKMLQVGEHHPDRDKQFQYIASTSSKFVDEGEPVISIDCKKKENIGNFKNNGHEYRHSKEPRKVLDHDFLIKKLGTVAPYGIYDISKNAGFINLGLSHDTAEFAGNSVYQWWLHVGKTTYPNAKKLYITCDGGGSNGSRLHLWKLQLAKLAENTGLEIQVSHFPPGTSKWNKIEHRLFCYISKSWEGQPLIDIPTVVNLIGSTRTKEGLTVKCVVDNNEYPTGIKVTDEEYCSCTITLV